MYSSGFFSKVLLALSYVAVAGILVYGVYTGYLILVESSGVAELIINLFVLVVEVIIGFYACFLMFHNAWAIHPQPTLGPVKRSTHSPLVTIVLPTYNPDLYALETNLLHLQMVDYPNLEVVITDNSNNPAILAGLEDLGQRFGHTFIHRDSTEGFKAGNLNYALEAIGGEYFVVVDVDQTLSPEIIPRFVQCFLEDESGTLAYVQAKFEVQNATNLVRTATTILYTFYYDVIALGKNLRQTVLFNGTSACLRTEIVRRVGGFPENSFTEDVSFSYRLLTQGYTARFLNEVATQALLQWRLDDLLSSFWRWTHGGTALLRQYGRQIASSPLSWGRKVELYLNGTSFVAFSGALVVALSFLLMYWGNLTLVRPVVWIFPLAVIFPSLLTLNHLFSCILGMVESGTLRRIPYLIPYGVASLCLSFFIVLPTLYALLGMKGPQSKGSQWNRRMNKWLVVLVLSVLTLVFAWSSLSAYQQATWEFTGFFAMMTLAAVSPIPFLAYDRFIDEEVENYRYFKTLRENRGLPAGSHHKPKLTTEEI